MSLTTQYSPNVKRAPQTILRRTPRCHVAKPRADIRAIRLGELCKLLRSRHGATLPDDDQGRAELAVLAHHLAMLPGDQLKRLAGAIDTWAPWLDEDDRDELVDRVTHRPIKFKAAAVGDALRLTCAERNALRITTIAAVDAPDIKTAARDKKRQQRRLAGRKPRAAYLAASLSRTKPWEADGISRSAWERRRRKLGCEHNLTQNAASVSRAYSLIGGDTPEALAEGHEKAEPVEVKRHRRSRSTMAIGLTTRPGAPAAGVGEVGSGHTGVKGALARFEKANRADAISRWLAGACKTVGGAQ